MTNPRRPTTILFVCSANLCRSVTAAAFAKRAAERIGAGDDWTFLSAGTHVTPGQRLPAQTEATMRDLGIPLRLRPRLVDETAVRRADLVLTAERIHRAKVVEWFPFAVRSTYTLLQFARLVEAGRSSVDDSRSADRLDPLRLAQIGRTHVQPVEDDGIDIYDPVRSATREAMVACAQTIDDALAHIVR